MKELKNIILPSIIWLVLFSSSCSNKLIKLQENPPFKISNAYTQKMVPGQQHAKPTMEVGFEIENLPEGITLDSLYYKKKVAVKINTRGIQRTAFLGSSNQMKNKELDANKVVLFYSKGKRKYYCILSDIIKKEDLFLP